MPYPLYPDPANNTAKDSGFNAAVLNELTLKTLFIIVWHAEFE